MTHRTGGRKLLLALLIALLIGITFLCGRWSTAQPKDVDRLTNRPHLPFAELHVGSRKPRPLTTESVTKLIRSPYVLKAALRSLEGRDLEFVRSQMDPVDWLEQSLEVTKTGPEFVAISLPGVRPAEAAPIVDAVAKAFQAEFVDSMENVYLKQVEELKQKQRVLKDHVEVQHRKLESFQKVIAAQQLPAEPDTAMIRREYTRLLMELAQAKALAGASDAQGTPTSAQKETEPKETPKLITDLAARVDAMRQLLKEHSQSRDLDPFAFEVRRLQRTIAVHEQLLDEIEAELLRTELEDRSDSDFQVRIFRSAEMPSGSK